MGGDVQLKNTNAKIIRPTLAKDAHCRENRGLASRASANPAAASSPLASAAIHGD